MSKKIIKDNPKIASDMYTLYTKISLPDDYLPYELQLISQISKLFPADFDWLTRVPFKRYLSPEMMNLIEQGLNSNDLSQRRFALLSFIDYSFEDFSSDHEMVKRLFCYSLLPNIDGNEFLLSLEELLFRLTNDDNFMKNIDPSLRETLLKDKDEFKTSR